MKTLLISIGTTLRGVAVILALGAGIVSCGVTAPDESPWQSVSAFSWPSAPGAMMRYRVEEKSAQAPDSLLVYFREERTDTSGIYTYNNQPMVMLGNESDAARLCTHFLALKDTLVTKADRTGSLYALVAPLEKGRTWISAYTADTVPSMRGTVIERFSEMKLEGTVYQNVIVIKYEPLDSRKQEYYWVRFFAKDVGAILTLKHFVPAPGSIIDPEPQPVQRTVLVDRTPANI